MRVQFLQIEIDSHTTPIFLSYLTHFLHVYTGETMTPPGQNPAGAIILLGPSLRSKRSSTKRTKFWPRVLVFFAFWTREKWGKSKKLKRRGWGRGQKGTFARKPLDFEKPGSPTKGAPDWCSMVILIDKCIKFV